MSHMHFVQSELTRMSGNIDFASSVLTAGWTMTAEGEVRSQYISHMHFLQPGLTIVTRDPVNWGGNLVLVASLQAVENAENLRCVATGAGGV